MKSIKALTVSAEHHTAFLVGICSWFFFAVHFCFPNICSDLSIRSGGYFNGEAFK